MADHGLTDKIITLPTLETFKDAADGAYAKGSASHAAYRSSAIPYGQVGQLSTSSAFVAEVDGVDGLYDGVNVMLRNGVVTSSPGFTLNVNSLGAKPVYSNVSGEQASFSSDYTMLFAYDSGLGQSGGWVCYRGQSSSAGSSDYSTLTGKPSIEGVTLVGDKTFPDLGIFIEPEEEYPQSDDYALTNIEISALWNAAS